MSSVLFALVRRCDCFTSNPKALLANIISAHWWSGKKTFQLFYFSLPRGRETFHLDALIWHETLHEIQICNTRTGSLIRTQKHAHTHTQTPFLSSPCPPLLFGSPLHQYLSVDCQKEGYAQELTIFFSNPSLAACLDFLCLIWTVK